MGSVTYRVLSMTDALVLALPPHVAIRLRGTVGGAREQVPHFIVGGLREVEIPLADG